MIDIASRDMDVPLSELGERQSRAVGRWFAGATAGQRPNVILTSPYVRAQQTAALILQEAALAAGGMTQLVDERLREKEVGVFDRLTRAGTATRYPEQAELRARLGKFYHRPPGGESWCDVILRLRGVVGDLQARHAGQRVLIVAHQVIVLCCRYLVERLTEREILDIDARGDVANCAVTWYHGARQSDRGDIMALRLYNFVAPVAADGTPVTDRPDAPVAPR